MFTWGRLPFHCRVILGSPNFGGLFLLWGNSVAWHGASRGAFWLREKSATWHGTFWGPPGILADSEEGDVCYVAWTAAVPHPISERGMAQHREGGAADSPKEGSHSIQFTAVFKGSFFCTGICPKPLGMFGGGGGGGKREGWLASEPTPLPQQVGGG